MTYKSSHPEAGIQPASGLPSHYSPGVAAYARGPFLDPQAIIPTDFRWRNARTYIVEHKDGLRYRALRIMVGNHTYGWWAIEGLGELLPLKEWEDEEREGLDEAVRAAKLAAGLDPDRKYPPVEFVDHLDPAWARAFWVRQTDRAIAAQLEDLCACGHPRDDHTALGCGVIGCPCVKPHYEDPEGL